MNKQTGHDDKLYPAYDGSSEGNGRVFDVNRLVPSPRIDATAAAGASVELIYSKSGHVIGSCGAADAFWPARESFPYVEPAELRTSGLPGTRIIFLSG